MSSSGATLLGGTFDPIHVGHLIAARSVMEQMSLEKVVLVPAAQPPHKTECSITDVGHRLEMVKLAAGEEDGFECSDCEMRRQGPSYTLDTIMHFRKLLGPDARLCWIIGADSLAELDGWYRVSDLVDTCEIITVARSGWDEPNFAHLSKSLQLHQLQKLEQGILHTPHVDVSSTDIRRRVAQGKSIRYLVPESVREYILDNQLFLHGSSDKLEP